MLAAKCNQQPQSLPKRLVRSRVGEESSLHTMKEMRICDRHWEMHKNKSNPCNRIWEMRKGKRNPSDHLSALQGFPELPDSSDESNLLCRVPFCCQPSNELVDTSISARASKFLTVYLERISYPRLFKSRISADERGTSCSSTPQWGNSPSSK